MKKEIFTAPEVADICRVSRQTLNRWLNSGELKGYRPTKNSDWRITRKELVKFVNNNNIPMDFLKEGKIKVLVIDDEVNVTSSIKRAFHEEDDFEIEIANSGFTAGVKLESFKPEVVVLDIFLGDMDGREFFKHIHQNPDFNDLKVIGISGKLNPVEIQPLFANGFNTFLPKPFEMEQLKQVILSVLEE